jgi:hypothetical protein
MIGIGIIFRRNTGSGGGGISTLMDNWIKEHIVFYYDVKKQGATNETLKESAYLQDLSGKGRRMKLNNFLFAEMSGVGGYELNWTDQSIWSRPLGSRFNGTIEPHKLTVTSVLNSAAIIETIVPSYSKKFKVKVSGVIDEIVAYIYKDTKGVQQRFDIREDGEYELPSNNVVEANFNMGWRIFTASYPHTCNITIEQIPLYPNALVTDGVDDYGLVENLSSGVKMLFMTVNPIGNYNINKMYYTQRNVNSANDPFSVFSIDVNIAYNYRNPGGETYINGTINESIKCNELFGRKHIITIKNDTVNSNNSRTPIYFSGEGHTIYFSKLAFYNSIAFDSIPTEADGFTEQELIDYVIDKYELK